MKTVKNLLMVSIVLSVCLLMSVLILNNFIHINKPLQLALNHNVLIHSAPYYGSGVVFKNGNHTFVWTCAHVISNNAYAELVYVPQTNKYKIERRVNSVIARAKMFNDTPEEICSVSFTAKIIRFSSDDDLALLELVQNDCFQTSVQFPTNPNYTPFPGMKIFHVGNFSGPPGEYSVSEGIHGITGLNLGDGKCYDRISTLIEPGSSGGAVYEAYSGRCIGLVARTTSMHYCHQGLIVPYRRMIDFTRRLDCEWAVNKFISVPDDYLTILTDDLWTIPPEIIKLMNEGKDKDKKTP